MQRSRARRVWVLDALLIALGTLIYVVGVRGTVGPLRDSFAAEPWALAALFCATEVFVVHVVFRREAYSVSLSEVPLVVGLFFATGPELLLAHLLGSGLAFGVYRRQPPYKLCFNLAHLAVGTGTALGVFHLLAAGSTGDPFTLRTVLVAMAATGAAVCVSAPAVVAAIWLYERRPAPGKLATGVLAHVAAGVANTSLALVAVVLVSTNPAAGWLMVVPTAVVLLAYRTLLLSQRKQESLRFLYEASGILHRGASREGPMVELLELARQMFNADFAELTLLPVDDGDRGLRTTVGPGDAVCRLQPVDLRDEPAAEDRGLPMPAMVAHLEGEHRRVGTMVLGGPSVVRRTFSRRDFQLFETLANHVAVAMENGVLETSLAQLTALKEELRHQAFHDDLTGLGNRALFVSELARVAERARPGEAIAVLFVDLDDFKTVNDTLGHPAGDELLVHTAERLRQCLRPQDVAARLGGDEFAVLLVGFRADEDAAHVAERLLAALREPLEVAGDVFQLWASIGVAVGAAGVCSVDELLRNADIAMYTAKLRGKGRWVRFEPRMQRAVAARHAVKTQLHSAVERDEFVLRYQPIVEIASGRIVGAEALVRWMHPTRGMLPPADFIELAEEVGLVGRMGRGVLRAACEQAREWQENRGAPEFLISVNVSPRELQHPDFGANVEGVLRSTGLDPATLLLEITENAMVDGSARSGRVMRELKALGVRLAVDDFGTGYSSLRYLDEFAIDILKVAKPFVDGLANDRNRPALAQAIVHLGHSLELELVAEGVESFDQLDALRAMGCRLAQGFLLSKPLEAAELTRLLARGYVPVHDNRRRHLTAAALRRRAAGLPA